MLLKKNFAASNHPESRKSITPGNANAVFAVYILTKRSVKLISIPIYEIREEIFINLFIIQNLL